MKNGLKDKPAVIYCAVNSFNNKKYIGIPCEKLSKRMTNHKCQALSQQYRSAFHRAIRKYGFESFNWYILSKWSNYQDGLNEEIRVIGLVNPEYNITKGGEGALGASYNLGKKHPYKKRRDGTGKNISNSLKKSKTLRRKKVICLDTGEVFNSLFEAGEKLDIDWTTISRVCRGKHARAGGKRFEFCEHAT